MATSFQRSHTSKRHLIYTHLIEPSFFGSCYKVDTKKHVTAYEQALSVLSRKRTRKKNDAVKTEEKWK